HILPQHAALLGEDLVEVESFYVLHCVEVFPVLEAGFKKANDVGVFEFAERFDLALESLEEADLLREFGGENLDGGLSSGQFFLGEVDPAHAAAAQFLE